MPKGKCVGQKRNSATTVSTLPVTGHTSSAAHDMETQTDSTPDSTIQAGSAAFDALMLAITTCQSTLTAKIDHVQNKTAFIRRDMDKIRDRVTEVERQIF